MIMMFVRMIMRLKTETERMVMMLPNIIMMTLEAMMMMLEKRVKILDTMTMML